MNFESYHELLKAQSDMMNKELDVLFGAKISKAEAVIEYDDVYPYIEVEVEDKDTTFVARLDILQDPEGNGPGFIAGVRELNEAINNNNEDE